MKEIGRFHLGYSSLTIHCCKHEVIHSYAISNSRKKRILLLETILSSFYILLYEIILFFHIVSIVCHTAEYNRDE